MSAADNKTGVRGSVVFARRRGVRAGGSRRSTGTSRVVLSSPFCLVRFECGAARYDFAVFGYLITEISTNFFPPGQGARLRLIEAFGVFGGAFLMRPLDSYFLVVKGTNPYTPRHL